MELIAAVAAAAFLAGYSLRGVQADGDDQDEIQAFLDAQEADLRERYTTTAMDYVAFEQEIALLEDPDTERIMRDAVQVSRVGPERALAIAREFDSYDDYRAASQTEFERINDIGDNIGGALAQRGR